MIRVNRPMPTNTRIHETMWKIQLYIEITHTPTTERPNEVKAEPMPSSFLHDMMWNRVPGMPRTSAIRSNGSQMMKMNHMKKRPKPSVTTETTTKTTQAM